MTPDELDAIEARAAAAAAGPWRGIKDGTYRVITPDGQIVAYSMNAANREFVQHAREDVPTLVAEVHRLRTVVGRVRSRAALEADDAKAGERYAGEVNDAALLAAESSRRWAWEIVLRTLGGGESND